MQRATLMIGVLLLGGLGAQSAGQAAPSVVRVKPLTFGKRAATPVANVGHVHKLDTVALGPRARYVASADVAGELLLWEVSTGRVLWRRSGMSQPQFFPKSAKGSKGDRILVKTGLESFAVVSRSGKVLRRVRTGCFFEHMAVSPKGDLVGVYCGGEILLYKAGKLHKAIRTWAQLEDKRVFFDAAGQTVLVHSGYSIYGWDVTTGKRTVYGRVPRRKVSYCPRADSVVYYKSSPGYGVMRKHQYAVYNYRTKTTTVKEYDGERRITQFAATRDCKRILLRPTGAGGFFVSPLLGTGARDMNLANAGTPIFQDFADNATSTHVLVKKESGRLQLVNLKTGRLPYLDRSKHYRPPRPLNPYGMRVLSDGYSIAVKMGRRTVVWDPVFGGKYLDRYHTAAGVSRAARAARVASCAGNGVSLYHLGSNIALLGWFYVKRCKRTHVTAQARYIFAHDDHDVSLVDVRQRKTIQLLRSTHRVARIVSDPSETLAAISTADQYTTLVRLKTGQPLRRYDKLPRMTTLKLTHRTLLGRLVDEQGVAWLYVWDLATNRLLKKIKGGHTTLLEGDREFSYVTGKEVRFHALVNGRLLRILRFARRHKAPRGVFHTFNGGKALHPSGAGRTLWDHRRNTRLGELAFYTDSWKLLAIEVAADGAVHAPPKLQDRIWWRGRGKRLSRSAALYKKHQRKGALTRWMFTATQRAALRRRATYSTFKHTVKADAKELARVRALKGIAIGARARPRLKRALGKLELTRVTPSILARIKRIRGYQAVPIVAGYATQDNDLQTLGRLRWLRSLRIQGRTIKRLDGLPALPQLEELYVEQLDHVLDLRPLARQRRLRKLTLMARIRQDTPLPFMPRLREVEVWVVGYKKGQRALAFLKHQKNLTKLTVHTALDPRALQALAHLPKLQSLTVTTMKLTDFTQLARIKSLRQLTFNGSALTDPAKLAVLKQITRLRCLKCTGLKAGRALKALPQLTHLAIPQAKVRRFKWLAALPKLVSLNLADTRLRSLKGLRRLTALEELDISGTRVRSLRPLRRLTRLRKLNAAELKVSSLSGLAKLTQLEKLDLERTRIRSLRALRRLSGLKWLDISRTRVSRLSVLKRLPHLEWLNISYTRAWNLKPLRGLKKLRHLSLSQRRFTNREVSALKKQLMARSARFWMLVELP